MAYDNNNSGMLSRNDRKTQETHPDFTGVATIDGRDYWISGWPKEGREGSKMAGRRYFKLIFKAKDVQPQQAAPEPVQAAVFDDDIPF